MTIAHCSMSVRKRKTTTTPTMWRLKIFIALLAMATTKCSAEINVLSTYEAFTDTGKRCIGDCGKVWGVSKRITTWHTGVETCQKKQIKRTTHYIGLDGKPCVSDCDLFGDETQWCAVAWEHWDYCSRTLATMGHEVVQSNYAYSTCLDECNTHGNSWYNWCNAGDGNWYRCDPTRITVAYNNPTETNERCVTRCKRNGPDLESPSYCYTSSHQWVKCFMNPPPSVRQFGNISCIINEECPLWTTSDDGQKLVRCTRQRRRSSRQSSTTFANELHFDCNLDVEDILLMHEMQFPIVELRPFMTANPITTNTNPILNYRTITTSSYIHEEQDSVDVPLNVEAVITEHTLDNTRERFRPVVDNNFFALDVGITDAHRNFDERGHMIAARLGGPTWFYNIFPQTRWSNRGAGSPWFALEAQIERFIRESPSNRYVRMWVALSYPVDEAHAHVLMHRPDGIGVRVRAYDDNRLVDLFTGVPVTMATNPQENMFFTNDPAVCCRA